MTPLKTFAKLLRSKNAGPFQLTIDIMFADEATYRHVCNSGAVNPQVISALLGTERQLVRIFHYDPAFAIKVTVPRPTSVGSPEDNDLFGGQQFGPLADLPIPDLVVQ